MASGGKRSKADRHQGFLSHGGFRWLIVAVLLCAAAAWGYATFKVEPEPSGGTWYGYALGTLGALLIVWLAMLGVRKRTFSDGNWMLKGWVSAHVYLGLALVVVSTLHTGFQFGWNLHTLAYGLVLLVVASGIVGVILYVRLPRVLSEVRGATTRRQILADIAGLDRQIRDGSQTLERRAVAAVRLSLEKTRIAGGFWRRLSGWHGDCANARALSRLRRMARKAGPVEAQAIGAVAELMRRKAELLTAARRQIRVRAFLEAWLYVHVPATFALMAALTAHIVSVFFYW